MRGLPESDCGTAAVGKGESRRGREERLSHEARHRSRG
jgi:hypothetical protein